MKTKNIFLTAISCLLYTSVAGEDEDKSITSIKAIHVKVAKPATDEGNSSTTFKVVLLANTEYYNDVTKLADLKGKTTQDITSLNAKEVGSSYLPMHSPELTLSLIHICSCFDKGR